MVPALCAAPVPLVVPLVLVLVPVLLPADVFFPLEVFEAVGALLVVEGEGELGIVEVAELAVAGRLSAVLDGRESVIVTGMGVSTVVIVVIPGKFASSPPKDSIQTADLPLSAQLTLPVKARTLEVPITYPSNIVYAAVEGPSVSVSTPGMPQLLLSVPGTHCMA